MSCLQLEERTEDRQRLARESLALLVDIFDGAGPLFEFEFFVGLLGQFELVNVNIEYDHPASAWLGANASLVRKTCGTLFDEVQRVYSCSERALRGVVPQLPPFMGLGLFRTVALTNHSCQPNLEVDFRSSSQAVVRALCDIAEGDELFISYIDEHAPLDIRQVQLRARYGFRCACPKCVVQAADLVCRRRLATQWSMAPSTIANASSASAGAKPYVREARKFRSRFRQRLNFAIRTYFRRGLNSSAQKHSEPQ